MRTIEQIADSRRAVGKWFVGYFVALFALAIFVFSVAAFAQQPAPTQENMEDANRRMVALREQRDEMADRVALLRAELAKMAAAEAKLKEAALCKPKEEEKK